jgi:hypothetical protein
LKRYQNQSVLFLLIVIAALGLLGALTWANHRFAVENPGGINFLVQWAGTRSLIFEGLSPYSDEVVQQIQTLAYGRPARPGEPELRAVYPLYSVIVFLPYALFSDFTLARAVWMTVLEASLFLLLILSLRLVRWRVGLVMMFVLLLFTVFWYHGVNPLVNGNAAILVALGLVGGFLALRAGADELAGVLFAFTTIKPQVVVLLLAFLVIWAIGQGRWRVVTWLFVTVFLLSASAALFIPDWILTNLQEVMRFPSYSPPGTPRAAFIHWWPAWGGRLGWALTGVMILLLLVEWWNNRRADFRGFLWTACLTLTISQWIGIQTHPGNFIVLFPAVILVFSQLDDRWRTGGRIFTILSLLLLFFGTWLLFLNTLQAGAQPQESPLMFFPLPAFLLVTLYWVRWWMVQPPAVWYDYLAR